MKAPAKITLTAILFLFFYSTLSAETAQRFSAEETSHLSRERELQYRVILLNKNILRPQKEIYKYNEPYDLIELVPILRDINRMIPRQFALAEHEIRLDARYITIQHEFLDVRTRRANKNSIISLSYSTPMGYFGSKLDVPLFYSSQLGFSDWSRYPMGNYTMTLNRDNPFGDERAVYIKALTRF